MPHDKSTDEIALAVLMHWRADFPHVQIPALAMAELLRRISAAIANDAK